MSAIVAVATTAHAATPACPVDRPGPPTNPAPDTLFVPCTDDIPIIDGIMDEGIWDKAAIITDFKQVDPIEGGVPSEKTEVRVLYSPEAIYFFLRAYETDPSNIIATLQERDPNLSPDDRFVIILDTFGQRRNAFAFAVNALGSRRDILFENNSSFFGNWDAIWYAKSRIDDEGWVAEIAIPTKSLIFEKGPNEWGFNISRRIKHRNEEVRWTNIRQDLANSNVSQIGRMTGLVGLDQGLGLDIKVAGAIGYTDDPVLGNKGFELDPSLDIFYRITPSITGALTFNTDFAEAAVDERKVNLTRFSLFFPETRDFFLQDVGIFEFADLDGGDINGRPFFTRRVGLTRNGIVDILGGGKITGRVGDVNFGLLTVQTDSARDIDIDSENMSVARVAVNILDESSIGGIVTHGNPSSGPGNTVYGMDFRYQNNQFMGQSGSLKGNAWFLRADTQGVTGGENAVGAHLSYSTDRLNWALRFKDIGRNYAPALGFANRRDIREYKGFARLRWRPEGNFLRTIDWREFTAVTTTRDNELETLRFNSEIKATTDSDDSFAVDIRFTRERLDNGFTLPHDIFIPAGNYNFVRPRLNIQTSDARRLSLRLQVEGGNYFNGTSLSVESKIDFKPSRFFFMGLRYEHTRIRTPGGNGVIRIGGVEFNWNISPDIQWANLIQYDNVSDNVGVNSRLRWIITPGSELFLVINQDVLTEDWDVRRDHSEAVIKIGHTFRL